MEVTLLLASYVGNCAGRKNCIRRVRLKFLAKLGKSATGKLSSVDTRTCGDDVTSRPRVFERHERFRQGRDEVGCYYRFTTIENDSWRVQTTD